MTTEFRPCVIKATHLYHLLKKVNYLIVLLKIDLGVDQMSSEKQFPHNAIIRERYNSGAIAPFTIITDADGKVLKTWNHKQSLKSSDLISAIQTTIEANKQ